MANTATKRRAFRESGPQGKTFLVNVLKLVIDTPVNEILAATLLLKKIIDVGVIVKDDDSNVFYAAVSDDESKILILDKATGAQTNITAGTYRVIVKGLN